MAREVYRLLAQLARTGHPDPDTAPLTSSAPRRRIARVGSAPAISTGERAGLWARLALGLVLGALMLQWPYSRGCGIPLAGYLAAAAMVPVAGAWIAVVSWRQRHAAVHLLALILVLWGLGLVAERVLPRVGYAAARAGWRCASETTAPADVLHTSR